MLSALCLYIDWNLMSICVCFLLVHFSILVGLSKCVSREYVVTFVGASLY